VGFDALTHSQKGAEQFQTLIFFAGKKKLPKDFSASKVWGALQYAKEPTSYSCLVVFTEDLRISSLLGMPSWGIPRWSPVSISMGFWDGSSGPNLAGCLLDEVDNFTSVP